MSRLHSCHLKTFLSVGWVGQSGIDTQLSFGARRSVTWHKHDSTRKWADRFKAANHSAMRGPWTAVLAASLFLVELVSGDVSPALLNAVSAASNASLLWGPYRPNLYFGVRPRLPKSLLTGLLWSNVDDYRAFQGIQLRRRGSY